MCLIANQGREPCVTALVKLAHRSAFNTQGRDRIFPEIKSTFYLGATPAGIEPANVGTKIPCLTVWRRG